MWETPMMWRCLPLTHACLIAITAQEYRNQVATTEWPLHAKCLDWPLDGGGYAMGVLIAIVHCSSHTCTLPTLPLPPHNYVYWNYFTERILPYCSKNLMASNCQLQWLTVFSLFCQFESYYIRHGNRIFSPITAEHTRNSSTYSFKRHVSVVLMRAEDCFNWCWLAMA